MYCFPNSWTLNFAWDFLLYFHISRQDIKELEFSRAHTLLAASASICAGAVLIWSMLHVCVCWWRMLGQLCAWTESTWPKAQVGVVDRRDQHKTIELWPLVATLLDFKQNQASFLLCLTASSHLQLTQVSLSPCLANFMPTTTTTDIQTDHFTPCTCTRGNTFIIDGSEVMETSHSGTWCNGG